MDIYTMLIDIDVVATGGSFNHLIHSFIFIDLEIPFGPLLPLFAPYF